MSRRLFGPIFFLAFVTLFAFLEGVQAQTVEEQALNTLANAQEEIRAATDDLYYYWTNITIESRYEILGDIQQAWEDYGYAKSSYDAGTFNDSLQEGYWSFLIADRASYRVFLDIAEEHIQRANSTIYNIPSYIPQPTEAKKKLDLAVGLYEEAYLSDVFDGLPPTETAQMLINAMHGAEDKLYWNRASNVVGLADEAWIDAISWTKSEEAAMAKVIDEQVNGISQKFYFQLLIPFAVGLLFSLIFIYQMMAKLSGWLKKKSNRNIVWDGDLWNKKWQWSSIIPTLGTLAVFLGLSWDWMGAIHGLSLTYQVVVPNELLDAIANVLWALMFLMVLLCAFFVLNRFRWKKASGLSFTILLIVTICLSLIAAFLSLVSLGQISRVV
jgi:hypothetical protein